MATIFEYMEIFIFVCGGMVHIDIQHIVVSHGQIPGHDSLGNCGLQVIRFVTEREDSLFNHSKVSCVRIDPAALQVG